MGHNFPKGEIMQKHNAIACMVALLCLFGPSARSQDTPVAAAAKAAELPSGESILDKYIEAVGGKEAFKKVKNVVSKGIVAGTGMSGNLTTYRATPNLFVFVMEIEVPTAGKILQGFDGKNGWGVTPRGPQVMSDKETNDMKNQNVFTEDWRAMYSKVETLGLEIIDGEECYKVAMTPKAGSALTNFYSKKTGLLLRSDVSDGRTVVQFCNKDYRKVDGMMFPLQTTIAPGGMVMVTMTFSEIKINADIPATTFDPPPEVKALLNK